MKSIQEYRAEQIENGELWDELKVDSLWIHVVRGQIRGRVIAEIGMPAYCTYIAIKAHTDLDTGNSGPSVETLAWLLGVDRKTVSRALTTLIDAGMLRVEKHGRKNRYEVIEQINLVAPSGEPVVTGHRKYIPTGFGDFVEELKRLARTGNLPGDKNITINVTFNVQQNAPGASGTINVTSDAELHDLVNKRGS